MADLAPTMLRGVTHDDPAGSGTRPMPPSNAAQLIAVVIALAVGGAGGGAIGGIGHLDAPTETRVAKLEEKVAALDNQQATNARMLREQSRSLQWIVTMIQKETVAIGALAAAQGVTVDLTPPMLPGVVQSTSP